MTLDSRCFSWSQQGNSQQPTTTTSLSSIACQSKDLHSSNSHFKCGSRPQCGLIIKNATSYYELTRGRQLLVKKLLSYWVGIMNLLICLSRIQRLTWPISYKLSIYRTNDLISVASSNLTFPSPPTSAT